MDNADNNAEYAYLRDVLGIHSFLLPTDAHEDMAAELAAIDFSTETHKKDIQTSHLEEPEILNIPLTFFRIKTDVASVFEGPLGALFAKIRASLQRPQEDTHVIEIDESQVGSVLSQLKKSQIVLALGEPASKMLQSKGFNLISTVDPVDLLEREDLKRSLWEDLKKAKRSLGWL